MNLCLKSLSDGHENKHKYELGTQNHYDFFTVRKSICVCLYFTIFDYQIIT